MILYTTSQTGDIDMTFTLSNLTLKNVYKIEIEKRNADLYGAGGVGVKLE